MAHPLDGIREKIKRAEQNLINLNGESNTFFDSGEHGVIPDNNDNAFNEALQYHSSRSIPIRFSVLAGEILYHMRSSLDHLVCELVRNHGGNVNRAHQFPIFKDKPPDEYIAASFGGQIKGVSPGAQTVIESFQPYKKGSNAANDPLWVLYDLNRIDKHQRLALVCGAVNLNLRYGAISIHDGEAELLPKLFGFPVGMNVNRQLSPTISFKEFGARNYQPVIPGLAQLLGCVMRITDALAREIK